METKTLATVAVSIPSGRSPLYKRYPGQHWPQSAHLEIDPQQRTASADWNAEIGNAVPFDVWHGRILRVPIYNIRVTAKRLREMLHNSAIQQLLGIICDDHEVRLDRTGSNMIGVLGVDGQEALFTLKGLLNAALEE